MARKIKDPTHKERERLNPGVTGFDRNNATDGNSAAIPGGSDEDIRWPRGRTAGAQAGHGAKTAEEDGQRGDADKPNGSSRYPTGKPD